MMLRVLQAIAAAWLLLAAGSLAQAQNSYPTPGGGIANGVVWMCLNASNQAVACNPAVAANPVGGNGTGTTGAVTGTLAAVAGKTTYICGFNVQAIGGTAAVGPITLAGLAGGSQIYQGSATAAGGPVASATFQPCIPASAANTPITLTTTADGTATAVNVNSWGFQF